MPDEEKRPYGPPSPMEMQHAAMAKCAEAKEKRHLGAVVFRARAEGAIAMAGNLPPRDVSMLVGYISFVKAVDEDVERLRFLGLVDDEGHLTETGKLVTTAILTRAEDNGGAA